MEALIGVGVLAALQLVSLRQANSRVRAAEQQVSALDGRVKRIEKNRLQWRLRVERLRQVPPEPCREVGIVNGRRICADD